MGFWSSIFGGKGSDNSKPTPQDSDNAGRFVSEKGFQENLYKQSVMSPMTLEQLRQYDVTDDTVLKLEFFFYSNSEENAARLTEELKALGYDAEYGPSQDDGVMIISGWTTGMAMSEAVVVEWTQMMCRRGYDHDCELDGWGTNPKQ
ncbi:MAG: hypothetical protein HN350_15755 [Phycisphaerales bacterium]|jgi:hypothetical protein|nr:hypothetical protein [Phycisphaerales bacterium]